jgi:hypothetical protein
MRALPVVDIGISALLLIGKHGCRVPSICLRSSMAATTIADEELGNARS